MKLHIHFFTITYLIAGFSNQILGSHKPEDRALTSPSKFNLEEDALATYKLIMNPNGAFSPPKLHSNSSSPFNSTKSRRSSKAEFQSPVPSPKNHSQSNSPEIITGNTNLDIHNEQIEEQALKAQYFQIFQNYVKNKINFDTTEEKQQRVRKLSILGFAAATGANYYCAIQQKDGTIRSPRIFGIDDVATSALITKVLPTAICSVAIAYIYNDIKQAFNAQSQYETTLKSLHERLNNLETNYKDQLTTTTNLKEVNEKMQQLLSSKIIPQIENIQTLIKKEQDTQAAFENWLNNTEIESIESEKVDLDHNKKSNFNLFGLFSSKK